VATAPQWWRSINRLGWVGRDKGVRCQHCGAVLAIDQRATFIAYWAVIGLAGATLRLISPYITQKEAAYLAVVMILGCAILAASRLAPLLLVLNTPDPGTRLSTDEKWWPQSVRAAAVRQLQREAQAEHIGQTEAEDAAAREVRCKKCSEANPGTFDSCWNCGSSLSSRGI
jgi:phage FluMu protein Com